MLQAGSSLQLALDLGLEAAVGAMDLRWRNAEENEKRSRARFAQNAMKPQEVAPAWEQARTLLGSPAAALHFVGQAMACFGAPLEPRQGLHLAHLYALSDRGLVQRLKECGLPGSLTLAAEEPAPAGATVLTRAHPLVATLAEALVEAALEPAALPGLGLGRVGAWPTAAVSTVTHLVLLRLRCQLANGAAFRQALLAEEAALVAVQEERVVASGEAARALLAAPATADLAPTARHRFLATAHAELPALLAGPLAAFAASRAEALTADHARLRAAAGASPRVRVTPVLPADVIGLFVLLPAEA
jgi:hypothetical protein